MLNSEEWNPLGPFVVTAYNADKPMKPKVVAGPFSDINEALKRADEKQRRYRWPLMIDKASAFDRASQQKEKAG